MISKSWTTVLAKRVCERNKIRWINDFIWKERLKLDFQAELQLVSGNFKFIFGMGWDLPGRGYRSQSQKRFDVIKQHWKATSIFFNWSNPLGQKPAPFFRIWAP